MELGAEIIQLIAHFLMHLKNSLTSLLTRTTIASIINSFTMREPIDYGRAHLQTGSLVCY